MSGHSKWAQIKRQKGVEDIKRGQTFTKLSNAIAIIVRQTGIALPEQNFKLRLLIEKAKHANMPKDTITRAIAKGEGSAGKDSLEEIVYEGFAPGKVAVIVEAVTDNKLRTMAEIKNIFDKNGAVLATPGSVSYQFENKGLIVVKKNRKSLDDIFLAAADAGAEDVQDAGEEVFVYTKPAELAKVKDTLVSQDFAVSEFELIKKPTVTVTVDEKQTAQKVLSFIEKIESLDDVQKVYANFDIPDLLLSV